MAHIFNNNTSVENEFQDFQLTKEEALMCQSGEKISREEKKLQYYLEMIQRQEQSEKVEKSQLKKEKIQAKPRPKSKNPICDFVHQEIIEPLEPVNITIVREADVDLDSLARAFT
mmetsp:Transcript_39063/g.44687  ORF Transcript_39063/g.44687 Transcript_39063/m.44687 type:complete len:115 (+) Transcript_39063:229-573(+)